MNNQPFGRRAAAVLVCQFALQLAFTIVMTAQTKSGLQISQFQGPSQECRLQVDFNAQKDSSSKVSISDDLNNYNLFLVVNPDTAEMRVCGVSHDYLDFRRPTPTCGADPVPLLLVLEH